MVHLHSKVIQVIKMCWSSPHYFLDTDENQAFVKLCSFNGNKWIYGDIRNKRRHKWIYGDIPNNTNAFMYCFPPVFVLIWFVCPILFEIAFDTKKTQSIVRIQCEGIRDLDTNRVRLTIHKEEYSIVISDATVKFASSLYLMVTMYMAMMKQKSILKKCTEKIKHLSAELHMAIKSLENNCFTMGLVDLGLCHCCRIQSLRRLWRLNLVLQLIRQLTQLTLHGGLTQTKTE